MQRNITPFKTEEQPTDYKCNGCGENFPKPLLATLSSSEQPEIFYACPRCLTKVNVLTHHKQEQRRQQEEKAEQQTNTHQARPQVKTQEDADCMHFFGYLRQRPKDTPIPDTCLTCDRMVECLMH